MNISSYQFKNLSINDELSKALHASVVDGRFYSLLLVVLTSFLAKSSKIYCVQ